MCVTFISFKVNQDFPLIIISNRDEEFSRPTKQAHFWETNPNVLAGVDLKEGGAWLAVSKTGKLAHVTNYRDPKLDNKNHLSRGHLVKDFIVNNISLSDFEIALKQKNYKPYNLIYGDHNSLSYHSNISDEFISLSPGNYGLSNGLLDDPWPKVRDGKREFETIVSQSKEQIEKDRLFQFMLSEVKYPEHKLPNTGISRDLEVKLSPLFINCGEFGTRTTTLYYIDNSNKGYFEEITFDQHGVKQSGVKFNL